MVTGATSALTVTLETVTPLFLAGAEPRGAPELRPPAFRGALRYWLRAALGAVIGDRNLDGLRQLESTVFGSTEHGSPITTRLQGKLDTGSYPILPHKAAGAGSRRSAFNAGQRFNLFVASAMHYDPVIWRAACASLNLAFAFGGVGLRSRRGFGTLRVVESSKPDLVPATPTSRPEWLRHVQLVTREAVTAVRALAQGRGVQISELPTGPTRFPCANQAGIIRISDAPQDPKGAQDAIAWLMDAIPKDRAFGGIGPRAASPLWVRPIRMDDRFGLLLLVLASEFPGHNYDTVRAFLNRVPGEDYTVPGWNSHA